MFTQFAASVKDRGTHLKLGADELVGVDGAPRTIIPKNTDFYGNRFKKSTTGTRTTMSALFL